MAETTVEVVTPENPVTVETPEVVEVKEQLLDVKAEVAKQGEETGEQLEEVKGELENENKQKQISSSESVNAKIVMETLELQHRQIQSMQGIFESATKDLEKSSLLMQETMMEVRATLDLQQDQIGQIVTATERLGEAVAALLRLVDELGEPKESK